MSLSPQVIAALSRVSTATITTVLLKKGLRNVWMRGARPLLPGQRRLVGPAFTLRFVPAREDLATPESWSSPISTRTAIEAMPEGCIAVVDAMGIADAGIFGDILCARMAKRKVAALVTDGVVRDLEGVLGTGLPVWCAGAAAPPSVVKRILPTMPEPTTNFIVPFVDTVHNRAAIEIQRGCTRGCRFCQAGMIFRPVRERPAGDPVPAQGSSGTSAAASVKRKPAFNCTR